jgi:hypothetical protein
MRCAAWTFVALPRPPPAHPVADQGVVTRALLGIVARGGREHALAEQICRACVAGLGVDGAALSLLTRSSARETLWATDPTAELLEDLQFTLNEGACMEAAATGAPVSVPDLAAGVEVRRWPVFAAALAEQAEVGALFALPRSGARSTSAYSTCTAAPRAGWPRSSGATPSVRSMSPRSCS